MEGMTRHSDFVILSISFFPSPGAASALLFPFDDGLLAIRAEARVELWRVAVESSASSAIGVRGERRATERRRDGPGLGKRLSTVDGAQDPLVDDSSSRRGRFDAVPGLRRQTLRQFRRGLENSRRLTANWRRPHRRLHP